jgi:hypothetical protein
LSDLGDISKLVGKRFKEPSETERHHYDLKGGADKERADQERAVPLLALAVYCCMNAVSFVLSILFRNLKLSCPAVVECLTAFDILEMSVQLLLHLNHFRVKM